VVTGVSVGSINTISLAGWEIGKELDAADFLEKMWKEITTDQVYEEWPDGILAGLW
jgi:hypothetical protein